MTKTQTPVADDVIKTTYLTPAEHAAQAGFTNWATVRMAGVDSTEMLLTTANGDTDVLIAGSHRAEQVLCSYEAVYTTDLSVPPHSKIILCAILTEGASHE